jgi:hypothetical protein
MTGREQNTEKCVNCQFYDRRNARPTDGRAAMWGQCRRHSPHLNPATAKSYFVEGVWPLIRDDDWCGEWRAPTQTSVVRSRLAPRPADLVSAIKAGSTSANAAAAADEAAAMAVGDD